MHETVPPTLAPPSWTLLGAEPIRAALEFAAMCFMRKAHLPVGDGHAVVLFPGLASDQRATRPLKSFCQELGYRVFDWGRGFNTGPQGAAEAWLDGLSEEIDRLTSSDRQKITLIGWSLGGIYAREVGKRLQPRVRQVITLGTPFAGSVRQTRAGLVYRLLNGKAPPADEALSAQLKTAPDVPTTSIYSRSDGIVAWQSCIQSGQGERIENVAVDGSHCGLGWNSEVLAVIADRLGQPDGQWRPYRYRAPWF